MNKSGFTLIELLVVVMVTALLFGVGIANFNEYNRKQTVAQAAEQVKNLLRTAQSKAQSGEKDCNPSFCGGTLDNGIWKCSTASKSLDKFTVNFQANGIAGFCGGTLFGWTAFSLPAGTTITYTHPVIEFFPYSAATPVTICLTRSSYIYQISTTALGEIKDGGFVASCP